MARYNLSLVFEQPSADLLAPTAQDLNGWTVDDWFNDGFIGWDPQPCTYFLHLEAAIQHPEDPDDAVDVLAWNFGQRPGDLVTPFEVQAILGALFNVNGFETFKIKPDMVLRLLDERDRLFTDRAVLSALRNKDEEFALSGGKRAPSPKWLHWLHVHAKAGVKASDRLPAITE